MFSSIMEGSMGDPTEKVMGMMEKLMELMLQIQEELNEVESELRKIEELITTEALILIAQPISHAWTEWGIISAAIKNISATKTLSPVQRKAKIADQKAMFVKSQSWSEIVGAAKSYYENALNGQHLPPPGVPNVFIQQHNGLVADGADGHHSGELRNADGKVLDLVNYFQPMREFLTKMILPLNHAMTILHYLKTKETEIDIDIAIKDIRNFATSMFNFVQQPGCTDAMPPDTVTVTPSTGLISCATLALITPANNESEYGTGVHMWLRYGTTSNESSALAFFTFDQKHSESHCIQETSGPDVQPPTCASLTFTYLPVPTTVSSKGRRRRRGNPGVPAKAWHVQGFAPWENFYPWKGYSNDAYFTTSGDDNYMCMEDTGRDQGDSFPFYVTFFPTTKSYAPNEVHETPLPTPGLSMRMVTGMDSDGFCYIRHSGGYMLSQMEWHNLGPGRDPHPANGYHYCRNDGPEVYFWLHNAPNPHQDECNTDCQLFGIGCSTSPTSSPTTPTPWPTFHPIVIEPDEP